MRILAMVDNQWALASSCLSSPNISVNGFKVISKSKSYTSIPPSALAKLQAAAAKFNINLTTDMCEVDNSRCAN